MGEVYRARDSKLDRDVAIKVLPSTVANDADTLSRFEREAKAVAALSHPNILAIHDFGRHDGIAYAVTELLEGETLRGRLDGGVAITQRQAVDYAQIPELAQRGLARVQHFFETLNERLAGREFVATDRFSLADITAVVAVDFARVVRVKPGEQHPELLRWRAAMAQRPSMSH